jgi:hypothetical protein
MPTQLLLSTSFMIHENRNLRGFEVDSDTPHPAGEYFIVERVALVTLEGMRKPLTVDATASFWIRIRGSTAGLEVHLPEVRDGID